MGSRRSYLLVYAVLYKIDHYTALELCSTGHKIKIRLVV